MAPVRKSQTLFGNRLYRMLTRRLHIPWAYSIPIVRGAKTIKSPVIHLKRRALAQRLSESGSPFANRVREADGYSLFGPDELPGARDAAAACARIYDRLQADGSLMEQHHNKKQHLRAIQRGEDFAGYPEISRFIVSRPVLEIAASYLGSAPILSTACLLWSIKTETIISSQRYHVDGEDVRQLKLFVNAWDHTEENGPLTFYSAKATEAMIRNGNREQRLRAGDITFDDPFVEAGAGAEKPIACMGEAGSGVFLDTSRCMHYGSRGNRKERLMLMVQYAPHNFAREGSIDLGPTDWIPIDGSDELQRLALQR
jgi:hypothetical protein